MQSIDDKTLIFNTLEGDTGAYSELINKYSESAFNLAFKILKNREDAEESSQDAFFKAYKGLDKFKGDAAFSTWLYRIVYNNSLNMLKKQKKTMVDIHEIPESCNHGEVERALNGLIRNDRKKFIQLAMNKLNEEQCALIQLFYHEEKDMHEIGEILNLSPGNVRVKLTRTRKKLLSVLEKILQKEIKDFAA